MIQRVSVLAVSVAILTGAYGSCLHAEPSAGAPDEVLTVPAGNVLSAAELLSLEERVNPLPSPDTSSLVPDVADTSGEQGVMRTDGADYSAEYTEESYRRAYGSFGIPYTTTRVMEGNGPALNWMGSNRLSTTYPYRAVGKLTFSAGYCSASLIRKSIIVTAAHCIQDFGDGSSVFSNFQFRPGHFGPNGATTAQVAPYGTWRAMKILRPGSWAAGTDIGCGAARDNDIALIALRKSSAGRFLGDIVGYFTYGWNNYSFVSSSKTGNLRTAAVTSLGYPGLMDAGRIMQRTDGPTYTTTVCSAGQLWQGSNFTGGSSGGPWVVNFASRNAALSGGAVSGTAPAMAIVGVTSWGASDPNQPKDNYSSQFRQNSRYPNSDYGGYGAGNIGSLLNTLCSSAAPEGGTLKSQGYCN